MSNEGITPCVIKYFGTIILIQVLLLDPDPLHPAKIIFMLGEIEMKGPDIFREVTGGFKTALFTWTGWILYRLDYLSTQ